MARDTDLEAELRREAMDRLIAASTGGAAGREAIPPASVPGKTAPGRSAGQDGNIVA